MDFIRANWKWIAIVAINIVLLAGLYFLTGFKKATCPSCPEVKPALYREDHSRAYCPSRMKKYIIQGGMRTLDVGSYVIVNSPECDMNLTGDYRIVSTYANAGKLKMEVVRNLIFNFQHTKWDELTVNMKHETPNKKTLKTDIFKFSNKEPNDIVTYTNTSTPPTNYSNDEFFYKDENIESFDLTKVHIEKISWSDKKIRIEFNSQRLYFVLLEKIDPKIQEPLPTTTPPLTTNVPTGVTPSPTTQPAAVSG